jgi:hypothetical protein
MTAPRRRWSFTLRTLFAVVTVLSLVTGWVVYHLNWIRERHRKLESGNVEFLAQPTTVPLKSPPWPLAWLGEGGSMNVLQCFDVSDQEAAKIQSLFPECSCVWIDSESNEFKEAATLGERK